MQTEDLKENSKQTTAEETPQQETQTNAADAADGVDETAAKKSEGAAEEKTPEQDEKDAKIEELQNRVLRLQADFDNFRRRNPSVR
ncbi:hypothetical protein [Phascolarctobacterium sp.]